MVYASWQVVGRPPRDHTIVIPAARSVERSGRLDSVEVCRSSFDCRQQPAGNRQDLLAEVLGGDDLAAMEGVVVPRRGQRALGEQPRTNCGAEQAQIWSGAGEQRPLIRRGHSQKV